MSINYCTLTSSTTDAFCGNRRQIVINQLLAKKYPPAVQGGSPRVLRDDRFPIPPQFEFEDRPPLTFEQPFITVSIEYMGETAMQQLDNAPQMHFVTVTGLQIDVDAAFEVGLTNEPVEEAEVSVNITDLRM